jgi:glycosyltransferase 2 family protein
LSCERASRKPYTLDRFRQVATFIIALAAIIYFVHFVARTLSRAEAQRLLTPLVAVAIIAGAVASVGTVALTGWAWRRLLQEHLIFLPTRSLSCTIAITQFAKYLPGNVGHHLARTAFALRAGIPGRASVATQTVEAILTVGAAVTVAVLGFALRESAAALPLSLGLGLGALALIRLGPEKRSALLAYTVNFGLLGTGLYLIAFAVAQLSPSSWSLCVGAFALAWVAGFVVPGAPAGLGVREGLLAGFLLPATDTASALVIVLGFRVATTLGDLLSFALGWWLQEAPAKPVVPDT